MFTNVKNPMNSNWTDESFSVANKHYIERCHYIHDICEDGTFSSIVILQRPGTSPRKRYAFVAVDGLVVKVGDISEFRAAFVFLHQDCKRHKGSHDHDDQNKKIVLAASDRFENNPNQLPKIINRSQLIDTLHKFKKCPNSTKHIAVSPQHNCARRISIICRGAVVVAGRDEVQRQENHS